MKTQEMKKPEPISKREGRTIEQDWTRNLPKTGTTIEAIEKLWNQSGNWLTL